MKLKKKDTKIIILIMQYVPIISILKLIYIINVAVSIIPVYNNHLPKGKILKCFRSCVSQIFRTDWCSELFISDFYQIFSIFQIYKILSKMKILFISFILFGLIIWTRKISIFYCLYINVR